MTVDAESAAAVWLARSPSLVNTFFTLERETSQSFSLLTMPRTVAMLKPGFLMWSSRIASASSLSEGVLGEIMATIKPSLRQSAKGMRKMRKT